MIFSRTLVCSFLILLCYSAEAQYHEWVNVNSPYLRIKTHQNGIYYLTLPALTDAGLPAGTDPRTLQLFRRGLEQQIHVSGEADGSFDEEDTLYFYGQRNDGQLDSSLYKKASDQLHPWLNLYSDTAVYFLSWGIQHGLRMSSQNLNFPELAPFNLEKISVQFHQDYARGKSTLGEVPSSKFDVGEGWCSIPFVDSYSFTLDNIHGVYPGLDATLEIHMVGRNTHYPNRKVIVKIGNPQSPDFQDTLEGLPYYEKFSQVFNIPYHLLSNAALQITLEPIENVGSYSGNYVSVSYCQLSYTQSFSSVSSSQKIYHITGHSTGQHASLAWSSESPMIFDITHPDQVNLLPFSFDGSQIFISYPQTTDSFLVVSKASLLKPAEMILKHYALPDINSAYNIVSHPALEASVLDYAAYRASPAGGNYTVSVASINDLYDLFSYGEETPLALFRYGKYLTTHNPDAQFLVLIGSAVDIYYFGFTDFYRWNPESIYHAADERYRLVNLVPTAGNPGSDLLFVMDKDLHPKLAVGRIQAKNNTQVLNYLHKVMEQEANTTYEKKLIHLSGGREENEAAIFTYYTNAYKSIVENSIWNGKVIRNFHKTDFPTSINDILNLSISDDVNAGVSFITFFGHAAINISDPNFGYVSDNSKGFANKGKYPMLIMNGCDAGNIFESYSMMEDWVSTPDRGAIAGLGSSEITYSTQADIYCTNFYKQLFDKSENIGKPVGEIINSLLNDPAVSLDETIRTQMILCGDPAVIVNAAQETTPIHLKENLTSMMIQPNPNQGVFTLESKMEGSLEILNANGSLVYEDQLTIGTHVLQVELPPGMYMVRLAGADHQECSKLLIY